MMSMNATLTIILIAVGAVGFFVLAMSLTLIFKGHHIDSEISTNKKTVLFILLIFISRMFNITPCTIATARVIIAIFGCHILTGFLHRTLYTESLHILVSRDFGVDMMPLKYQRQRHCQYKKCHCTHRH